MEKVLITGVSSGIGLELTKKFLEIGYQVFGNVRSEIDAAKLQYQLSKNFQPLIFDICNKKEIERARQKFETIIGNSNLVCIINNADIATFGPLVYIDLKKIQKQLETSVVGQLNVIQHFYKYLIPKNTINGKRGRIINISSVSGTKGSQYIGSYVAGKHALEGLSKVLRKELKVFGIDLILISPSNVSTTIWQKVNYKEVEKYKDTIYFQSLKKMLVDIQKEIKTNAISVNEFADAFLKIFFKSYPAFKYSIKKSRVKYFPFSKLKVRAIKV